jgi:KaiC/GvpD/RAD55 family RecA-like ATPase
MAKYNPELSDFENRNFRNCKIPDKLIYVTFSHAEDYIKNELKSYFDIDYFKAFEKHVTFKDFSEHYFKSSIIPSSWSGTGSSTFLDKHGNNGETDLLRSLVAYLDENANGAMVIIDSLTDLLVSQSVDSGDLIDTVKGLQRVAKKWSGIIYLLLTDDIVPKNKQQIFTESVDGILMFEWGKSVKSAKRLRYMYIEKFTSLLPYIQREKIARFMTDITPKGLTVCDWELIS